MNVYDGSAIRATDLGSGAKSAPGDTGFARGSSRHLDGAGEFSRPVRGILFDMEDVLYDGTAWRRWLLQQLPRIGLHTHYQAFYHVWGRDYLAAAFAGRGEYWDTLREYLVSAGLSAGQVDEVLTAGQTKYLALQRSIRPLRGVISTVAHLAASGLQLGVVCNSTLATPELSRRLDRLGMRGRFCCLVTSLATGSVKPDSRIYAAALSALDLSATEVVYVGHNTAELAGAARAGMRTIAVNHGSDAAADVFLDSIDELLHLVGNRPLRRAG